MRRFWAMTPSFLYLAFVRMVQLLRLSRPDDDELAIEVMMLCNEVAVVRRQVHRPMRWPPIGRCWPGWIAGGGGHRNLIRRHLELDAQRRGRPEGARGHRRDQPPLFRGGSLGLPPHPRQARHHGYLDRPIERLGDLEAPRHRTFATEVRAIVGGVPRRSDPGPARLGLLQRRHRALATALCSLHPPRHSPRPGRRRDGQAGRNRKPAQVQPLRFNDTVTRLSVPGTNLSHRRSGRREPRHRFALAGS